MEENKQKKKTPAVAIIIGVLAGVIVLGIGALGIGLIILFSVLKAQNTSDMMIVEAEGKVSLYREDRDKVTLEEGDTVYSGDMISTGKKATATIKIDDDIYLTIQPKSEIMIMLYNNAPSEVTIIDGSCYFEFKEGLEEGQEYNVLTEDAVIYVDNKKSKFMVTEDDGTYLTVDKGRVRIETEDDSKEIAKGESVYSNGGEIYYCDDWIEEDEVYVDEFPEEYEPEYEDEYIDEEYAYDESDVFGNVSMLSDSEKLAYASLLKLMSYEMSYYYWQFDYEYNGWGYDMIGDNPVVAFADVNGDYRDEMLLVRAREYNADCAYLEVYGINADGDAELIGEKTIDVQAAGGMDYYFFMTEDNQLYYYCAAYDEGSEAVYEHIYFDDNDDMVSSPIVSYTCWPDDSYTYDIETYYEGLYGAEITADEYFEIVDELEPSYSVRYLFYDAGKQDYVFDKNELYDAGIIAMTYAEARRALTVEEYPENGFLPFSEPIGLTFASGVGGWSTDIVLYPNGEFEGIYHDSDMGDTGAGYPNGTLYYCDFSGQFVDIERLDEYTYKMTLSDYTIAQETGTEEIIDEMKYVYSEPYGIYGGDVFYLYTPGYNVDELPEEYVGWVWGLESKQKLPGYGLYNEAVEEGFSEY